MLLALHLCVGCDVTAEAERWLLLADGGRIQWYSSQILNDVGGEASEADSPECASLVPGVYRANITTRAVASQLCHVTG